MYTCSDRDPPTPKLGLLILLVILIGRAGVSPPSRTTGPIFMYIYIYIYRSTVCQDTIMFLRASFLSSHFDISWDTRLCHDVDGRARPLRTIERALCF